MQVSPFGQAPHESACHGQVGERQRFRRLGKLEGGLFPLPKERLIDFPWYCFRQLLQEAGRIHFDKVGKRLESIDHFTRRS